MEIVAPKTKQEEMADLTKEVGQAFFESGKLKYEIELKQRSLEECSIKIHNLNQKALKLQGDIDKEVRAQAMKVALPATPGTPEHHAGETVGFA